MHGELTERQRAELAPEQLYGRAYMDSDRDGILERFANYMGIPAIARKSTQFGDMGDMLRDMGFKL